jgi:preprotein translocase subunit SecA
VAGELREVYALETVRIPLHRPSRRHLLPDRCCRDAAAKWQAVADEVRRALARGQPVLVGTRSVKASEALAAVLVQAGIEHQLLNARQDADEAAQVARAGEAGRVTVATNMAGRGTDIRLAAEAEVAGGLHVILTEYHESPRIDRQLVGRCARQGDHGSAVGVVALDDELLRDHGGWLRRLLAPGGLKMPGTWALRWLRWECQRRAGRQGERLRRQTMKQERQTDDALAFAGQTR